MIPSKIFTSEKDDIDFNSTSVKIRWIFFLLYVAVETQVIECEFVDKSSTIVQPPNFVFLACKMKGQHADNVGS